MPKRITILFLMIGMMIVTACSANQHEDTAQDHSTIAGKSDGHAEKDKPIPAPFQPIEPSKSATALETNYTDEENTWMPRKEALGDEIKRSVSLGQTLLRGKEDHTNGPLKNNRLVAFYGTPASKDMGVLGEHPPEEMMEKLKERTAAYSNADPDRPAVPTIELIATVAQRTPGPDNLYVSKPSKKIIDEYAKLAKENGALLLLDIQLGRGTIMDEIKEIEPYLKLPYVHLAIDTEYSVDEGEIPGEDLGEVDGEDVQEAIEYMDRMVEDNNLPDKMVLVHQFGNGIVKNKDKIKPTKHVEVPLNYDGFGDSAVKMSAYGKLVRDQPIQYGGFKLFFKNDEPLLSPEEVLKLDPAPAIINYQ